jgi:hypothetical protein
MNGPNVTVATDSPREMNWKLLRPYGRGLQVVGWMVIAFFVLNIAFGIYVLLPGSKTFPGLTLWSVCMEEFDYVRWYLCPGFVLLVLAQLIRCLTEKEYFPGGMLRYGHWVLFLYGTLLLVRLSWRVTGLAWNDNTQSPPDVFSFVVLFASPLIVRAILVFGVALILRRLVSIVEESKTLV